MSQSQLSRFERGAGASPNIDRIARLCAVVGQDLSFRAFPAGPPLRDAAHVALLNRLRKVASSDFRWSIEVPLPIPGDRRARDSAACSTRTKFEFFVEAESRLRDIQAVARRVTLKKRDAGGGRVILLVRDTRANRTIIFGARDLLRELFPVPGNVALAALRDGRDPGGDAMVLLYLLAALPLGRPTAIPPAAIRPTAMLAVHEPMDPGGGRAPVHAAPDQDGAS